MNVIDLVLALSIVIAVGHGWRMGILRGAFGLAGRLAGAWFALRSVPIAFDLLTLSTLWKVLTGIGLIVAFAMVGESIGIRIGDFIRRALLWRPIRFIDSLFGSAFRVLSLGVILWLLSAALSPLPDRGVVQQVRDSRIVTAINDYAPEAADRATAALRAALRSNGFPVVFAEAGPEQAPEVEPADPSVLRDADVRETFASIVKVEATSDACGERVSGSGLAYAPGRIMTNAHVVAGAERITVQVDDSARRHTATVVYFDAKLDVAVLAVDGLDLPSLAFGDEPRVGQQAVVPGFTGGDPLSPDPARVRQKLIARGHDIYGKATVDRAILVLRAAVAPGDSGAPLVGLDGRVIGLVFAAGTDAPETGYALTLQSIERAAALGRERTDAVSNGECVPIA